MFSNYYGYSQGLFPFSFVLLFHKGSIVRYYKGSRPEQGFGQSQNNRTRGRIPSRGAPVCAATGGAGQPLRQAGGQWPPLRAVSVGSDAHIAPAFGTNAICRRQILPGSDAATWFEQRTWVCGLIARATIWNGVPRVGGGVPDAPSVPTTRAGSNNAPGWIAHRAIVCFANRAAHPSWGKSRPYGGGGWPLRGCGRQSAVPTRGRAHDVRPYGL